jgi:16S rRNA C1402 N4-methylase RsmH
VKLAFKAQQQRGAWDEIARRPAIADEAELADNPRSHSAKLRWARRAA